MKKLMVYLTAVTMTIALVAQSNVMAKDNKVYVKISDAANNQNSPVVNKYRQEVKRSNEHRHEVVRSDKVRHEVVRANEYRHEVVRSNKFRHEVSRANETRYEVSRSNSSVGIWAKYVYDYLAYYLVKFPY